MATKIVSVRTVDLKIDDQVLNKFKGGFRVLTVASIERAYNDTNNTRYRIGYNDGLYEYIDCDHRSDLIETVEA